VRFQQLRIGNEPRTNHHRLAWIFVLV